MAWVDIDDTVKATYGYAKQGAGYGYSGVKGLNALLATVSTPTAAPVIVGTRLRKGSANSARGAARLVGDALAAAKRPAPVVPTAPAWSCCAPTAPTPPTTTMTSWRRPARAGVQFSITARANPQISKAIEGIDQTAWTAISYLNAVWDDDEQRLISDAEIAEVPFTRSPAAGRPST